MFWLEPLVEVETDGGPHRPTGRSTRGATSRGLFDAGLRRAHPLALGPAEEIPFFARQTRLTFARCGIIDPLSLAEYAAHGGLAGLRAGAGDGPAGDRRGGDGDRACAAAAAPASRPASSGHRRSTRRATAEVHRLQRRRGRQRHLRRPDDHGGRPFVLIEGMAIAGLAVGATKGYVYIRSEYPARHRGRCARRSASRARPAAARRVGARLGPRLRHGGAGRRRRLCLRRGDGAAEEPGGQARRGARQAAAAGHRGAVRQADGDQQRASRSPRCRSILEKGRRPTPDSAWAGRAGRCRCSSPATSGTAGCSRRPSA